MMKKWNSADVWENKQDERNKRDSVRPAVNINGPVARKLSGEPERSKHWPAGPSEKYA